MFTFCSMFGLVCESAKIKAKSSIKIEFQTRPDQTKQTSEKVNNKEQRIY